VLHLFSKLRWHVLRREAGQPCCPSPALSPAQRAKVSGALAPRLRLPIAAEREH
jgi:hypothetical protein